MTPRPHIRCRECGAENTIICICDVTVTVTNDRKFGYTAPRFKCTSCQHDGVQATTVFVPAIPESMVEPSPVTHRHEPVDPDWDPEEEREARRARQRAKGDIRQQDPVRRSRR